MKILNRLKHIVHRDSNSIGIPLGLKQSETKRIQIDKVNGSASKRRIQSKKTYEIGWVFCDVY